MIAEILSTGEEVRSGAVIDTNAAYIAQCLEARGIEVARHLCVGDDVEKISDSLRMIAPGADFAVVTGGLGPTGDDLTADAAAMAFGVNLRLDSKAMENVTEFFRRRNRKMSPSNEKQAWLPEGAEMLYNPTGTAPGFMFRFEECCFFFLPGVPSEMVRMMHDAVLPRIARLRKDDRQVFAVRTLCVFGLPEPVIGERLAVTEKAFQGVRLGLRSVFPEVQVKLYGRAESQEALEKNLDDAADRVCSIIGDYVFSRSGLSMEAVVGNLLKAQNATLAVSESCTGGLISHLLTEVAGSSDYFLFSGVTYSNEAKIKVLGVSRETLDRFGAVSEQTAMEMARGARRISGADYAVSTTGIAGPDGGGPEKPVGTVCIGFAGPKEVVAWRYCLDFADRSRNKQVFAMKALDQLRRSLLNTRQRPTD